MLKSGFGFLSGYLLEPRRLARKVGRSAARLRAMGDYALWVQKYDTLNGPDRAKIRQRVNQLSFKPLISVLMPVYNVEERWLRKAIESVRAQLYPHWELCIADDHSHAPHVRRVLEEYCGLDSRIKVTFRTENGHISVASNTALEMAKGEFIALLDHDDELTEHALYLVAEELNAHPEADLIYTDEDKISEKGFRFDPHFKSDWNPDLFLSLNLITHLAVYRAGVVKKIGGFTVGMEGSQDYDLSLRVIEQIPEGHIRHIPFVCYHWRAIQGSVAQAPGQKNYAHEAARRAIQAHLDRKKVPATVGQGFGSWHKVSYPLPPVPPKVSLVVSPGGRSESQKRLLEGISRTDYPDIEVVTARSSGRGALVGFLDGDLEIVSVDWLTEMVGHALRPEIGAVGAKLLYPDGSIQHGGIVTGAFDGIAGYASQFLPNDRPGHQGRAQVIQNFSAVSSACMIMRREVFDEVGGFEERNLPMAYRDVDLCLRIREEGYRILWTPEAKLVWRKKKKAEVVENAEAAAFMRRRWGDSLLHDPCYSPNLSLKSVDFRCAFPPRAVRPWTRR